MRIPSCPILRLLRRPNGAPPPAPMHSISPPSRSLLSSMASRPPPEWLPTLARQAASVTAALYSPVCHASRFPHGSQNMTMSSGVKAEESRRSDRRRLIPSFNDLIHATKMDKQFPITRGMDNEENRAETEEFIVRYGDARPAHIEDGSKIFDAMNDGEDVCRTVVEVTDGKQDPMRPVKDLTGGKVDARGQRDQDVYPCDVLGRVLVLPESSHRDGSIYRDNWHWKKEYCIANRSETRLEAMMLSDPSKFSGAREPCSLWQIFSLKVAKIPVNSDSVELYGYIAARDQVDPLLNYVVNISRDDPVIVVQGSLIEMAGPKQGIKLSCTVLLEYDMWIKTGDQKKDDLQLIDGVSAIDELITWGVPVTQRIHENCGAIDMTQVCLEYAVEATVEVVISEVQSSFDLCLSCFTSGLHEEIRLFDGVISAL